MPGKNINRGAKRERLAGAVADMLLSMRTGERSVSDCEDLTGLYPETLRPWIDALAQVGVIVEGERRKVAGRSGVPAKTWRMP